MHHGIRGSLKAAVPMNYVSPQTKTKTIPTGLDVINLYSD
jgi:hypothetical protein